MKYFSFLLLAVASIVIAGCLPRPAPTPPTQTGDQQEDTTLTPPVEKPLQEKSLFLLGTGSELVTIDTPLPASSVTSPFTITGRAPGYRFFEASAPVVLTNRDGLIIAEGMITALEDWMTEEIIPFSGTLTYTVDSNRANNNGTIILQKANASGLPENDASVEFQVQLQ